MKRVTLDYGASRATIDMSDSDAEHLADCIKNFWAGHSTNGHYHLRLGTLPDQHLNLSLVLRFWLGDIVSLVDRSSS